MNESGNVSGIAAVTTDVPSSERPSGGRPVSTAANDGFLDSLNIVQAVLTPILVIIGIFGNLFTVKVVREQRFKQMNCTVMLIGLAISDVVMLLTTSLNQTFMTSLPVDIRALSLTGCKIFYIVYRSAKLSSSWIVVLIAVDRFFAVVFPLRFKSWMCRRNILIIMAIISGLAIGFNILCSTFSVIRRGKCFASISNEDNEQFNSLLVLLRGIQYSFMPIVILSCVTPPIIFTLVKGQNNRERMVSQTAAGRSARELSRTTMMLTLIVILHVITSMPFTILFIRSVFYGESIFSSSDRNYFMFFMVSPTLEQVNHASNFFIYVLCSRPFRHRVFEIVRCACQRSERNGINGHGSESISVIFTHEM